MSPSAWTRGNRDAIFHSSATRRPFSASTPFEGLADLIVARAGIPVGSEPLARA